MKMPVVWVTASLTAAIVITATFLIATGTRGESNANTDAPYAQWQRRYR